MIRSLVLILALATPVPALAHNVISSVFPSGSDIEGEIGFSSGDMATDLLIEVFDESGNKLGETKTDADGFFIYTPSQPVTHIFRGDLGAGHVAEVIMPASEVAALMGQDAAQSSASASVGIPASSRADLTGLSDQTRAELATMIRTELRPLRQEISAYKNKNDLQTVLGGLGYIAGLFGLGFYIAARRKMGGDA
ncbi:nickel transport protein [Aliiroseovarius halocynthiae]|uniref:Cobalt ABC transporter permease n=1 Tax=Aliiroseovarius halocynthiae TaxID=985055 RepID=A0A545SQ38_9RHOB|nr:cobalt ABC transporter permease [Aliiroseovarius halocynthiae]TQV67095.1 cobalt ABC transporter permease [Aliiroseovarius halocynthiae]SMR82180.1 nickel transport protein [Aliiroseovarius halocynthiae]